VRLQSLVTNRYVTLGLVKGSAPTLVATAERIDEASTFVLVGDDSELSLRLTSGKYVTAPAPSGDPAPMTADAETIGLRERFALEPTLP
jgi:hypothetical protein